MSHERFHYKSLAEVKEKASELGVSLPFAEDTTILAQPLKVRDITFPNRLGIAPMEGADLPLQKKQDSMQSTSRAAMATCWQSFPLLIIAPANMVDALKIVFVC